MYLVALHYIYMMVWRILATNKIHIFLTYFVNIVHEFTCFCISGSKCNIYCMNIIVLNLYLPSNLCCILVIRYTDRVIRFKLHCYCSQLNYTAPHCSQMICTTQDCTEMNIIALHFTSGQ